MQREINKFLKKLSAEKLKKNHKECIELYNIIGGMYSEIGSNDEAIHYHEQALELCKTIGDRLGTAIAHRFIGEAKASLGQFQSAIETTKKYLEMAQRLDNKVETQRAWTTLGRVYLMYAQDLKDQTNRITDKIKEVSIEAEKRFLQALKLAETVRDRIDAREYAQMISGLHMNIGLVNDIRGMSNEAIHRITKAIEICKSVKLKEDLYRCQVSLSAIHRVANNLRLASKVSEDALNTAKSIGKKLYICDAFIERGLVKIIQRDFKGAKRAFAQAYLEKSPSEDDHAKAIKLTKLAHVISNTFDKLSQDNQLSTEAKMKLCDKLGDLFVAIGSYKLAIEFYRRALSDAKACGKPKSELARILFSIAETYADDGQYEHALVCFEKELTYRDGNNSEQCQSLVKIAHTLEYLERDSRKICDTYEKALETAGKDTKLMYLVIKDYVTFMQSKNYNTTRCVELEKLLSNLKSYPEVVQLIESEFNEDASEEDDEIADIDDIITDDEGNDEVLMVGRRRTRGANKFKTNEVGDTPLHEACIKGDMKRVKSLIEQGHAVNPRDHAGWIPIHEASNHGHLNIVEFLIEHGADVNHRGPFGVTPLHDAASNGHLEIMRLLLRAGANVIALTDTGETVLAILREYRRNNRDEMSNEKATECKSLEVELLNAMDRCGYNLMEESMKNIGSKTRATASAFQKVDPKPQENRNALRAEPMSNPVKDYRDTIGTLKRKRPRDDPTNVHERAPLPALVNTQSNTSVPTKDWIIDDVSKEKRVEQRRGPVVFDVSDSDDEDNFHPPAKSRVQSSPNNSQQPSTSDGRSGRRITTNATNGKRVLLDSDDDDDDYDYFHYDHVEPKQSTSSGNNFANADDDDQAFEAYDNFEKERESVPNFNGHRLNDGISNIEDSIPISSPISGTFSINSTNNSIKTFCLFSQPLVVSIEDKKLMIPIKDDKTTIKDLKNMIVERYAIMVKAKPIIKLAPLSDSSCEYYDDDLCKDVVRENIVAIIDSWQLKSIEENYVEACERLEIAPLVFIKLEMRKIDESSNELDFSYTRLPKSHIGPVISSLVHRDFTHANLTGATSLLEYNKLSQQLLDCIVSWHKLTRLTLKCIGLNRTEFEQICSKLKCPELRLFDLSYNGIVYKSQSEFKNNIEKLLIACINLKKIDLRHNQLEFVKEIISTKTPAAAADDDDEESLDIFRPMMSTSSSSEDHSLQIDKPQFEILAGCQKYYTVYSTI